MLAVSHFRYQEKIDSKSWGKTIGKIIQSSFEQKTFDNRRKYYLNIQYEYSVKNKLYASSSVQISPRTFLSEHQIRKELAKYPVGKNVTVFYKPTNFNKSILVREEGPKFWNALSICGAVFTTLSMLTAIISYSSRPGMRGGAAKRSQGLS